MAWTPPVRVPWPWKNAPSTTTPLSAQELQLADQDEAAYAVATVNAYDTYAEGQFVHRDGTGLPPSVVSASTKRVTIPVGSNGVPGPLTLNAPFTVRQLFKPLRTTTRWRLRFRNYSAATDGSGGGGSGPITGAINVEGLYVGVPKFADTGAGVRWDGSFFASSPSLWLPAFSSPADGSEYVSSWVTAANQQFQAHTLYGLSWGATTGASQTLIGDTSGGLLWWGTNADQQAPLQGVPVAPNFSPTLSIADWRIEYEFSDTQSTLVGLFIGDSITWGFGFDNNGTFAYQHEGWVGQAAHRNGFVAINAALGGAGSGDFGTLENYASNYRYQRFDLATTVPDFAVIMIGTNDLVGSVSATTVESNINAIINILKQNVGVKEVFVCTQIPRNFNATIEGQRQALNAWLRDLPDGVAGCIDMDRALKNVPSATIIAAPAAPGLSTAATGGTVAAGTYQVEVTYTNAFGESVASASASIVTTGTTSTITVNSPAPANGATGWYAYVTQAGGSTYFRQQAAGSPTAIGTNLTLTAPPTNTGANPPTSDSTAGTTAQIDPQLGTPSSPHPYRSGHSVMGRQFIRGSA